MPHIFRNGQPCRNHNNYKKVFPLNYLLNKSCAVTSVWTEQTYAPQSYISMILYLHILKGQRLSRNHYLPAFLWIWNPSFKKGYMRLRIVSSATEKGRDTLFDAINKRQDDVYRRLYDEFNSLSLGSFEWNKVSKVLL